MIIVNDNSNNNNKSEKAFLSWMVTQICAVHLKTTINTARERERENEEKRKNKTRIIAYPWPIINLSVNESGEEKKAKEGRRKREREKRKIHCLRLSLFFWLLRTRTIIHPQQTPFFPFSHLHYLHLLVIVKRVQFSLGQSINNLINHCVT